MSVSAVGRRATAAPQGPHWAVLGVASLLRRRFATESEDPDRGMAVLARDVVFQISADVDELSESPHEFLSVVEPLARMMPQVVDEVVASLE